MDKEQHKFKKIMTIVTVITTILLLLFIAYSLKIGFFESKEILINKIRKFGILGPLFFFLLQIAQVMFPVIPGGASCLAGVLAFGPLAGFLYNYISLTLGSVIVFSLSRKFGPILINKLFSKITIDKYLQHIKSKKFEWVFFWGILLPGAPDDILCYVAGISNMSLKKFTFIVLLCKPLTLIFYSLFTKYIL